jgi:hypothetical protein
VEWKIVDPVLENNSRDALPDLDRVVLIIHMNGIGGGPCISLGGLTDYYKDGKLYWGTYQPYRGFSKGNTTGAIEVEDLYVVTHWAEIEWPEIDYSIRAINEVGLPTRTVNVLREDSEYPPITTVQALADVSVRGLLMRRGCGKKVLLQIEEFLRDCGP